MPKCAGFPFHHHCFISIGFQEYNSYHSFTAAVPIQKLTASKPLLFNTDNSKILSLQCSSWLEQNCAGLYNHTSTILCLQRNSQLIEVYNTGTQYVHNFLNIIPSRTYPADTFLTWVSVVFESPIVIIGSSLIETLVPTNRAPTVVKGGARTSDLVTLSLLTGYGSSL